ncbi:tetratricopeptide repeat protein [Paenibacillus sp. GSMTC-2017]|uniref:tetratricopeptide repeat protein n=1 Tax=Paenibacillus sp. GSMTC-2017 TaxID=2794350 RepID=UPI0018D678D4|nr:tetratricopeptide repeat protein [Paenibacillus sp. GSMTC-2017]MBH5317929.1 tetratricopeptide repeat protein [Paenibacillus sp. GSMTC-2017]
MDGESCIRKAYELIFHSDFEGAIIWFEKAIELEPENASYYHKCAVSCARSGKWSKAKIYSDVAEKLEPDNEEFRFHSGVIQAKLIVAEVNGLLNDTPPNLSLAAERLRFAVMLDPLCFDAFYTLALVCSTDGLLDEAIEHAREALRLDPQHSTARRLFADISRKRRMERIRTTTRRK